jgi:hypothetical protein
MSETSERRNGIRVDFATKVLIAAGPQQTLYDGDSRDISLRGIFLNTTDILEINTDCMVEIRLPAAEDDIVLSLKGHIVRKEESGYAIYFDSVDLDSYTHLKNIIKYNSPD